MMLKKYLKKIFVSILLLYSLLMLFAWGFSDLLIFHPPRPGYRLTDDLLPVWVDTAGGSARHRIFARYYNHPGARYTVFYHHGNAVDMAGLQHLKDLFLSHGYSLFIYDYSGYGQSEGRPSESQSYLDARAAYRLLVDELRVDASNVIIYGHSLGSGVATWLAAEQPAAALVLESPLLSAFRVKTAIALLPFDKYDNAKTITRITMPLLVLHSRDDTVIPFRHGKRLYELARVPKRAHWFEHAGHTRISHQGRVFWQQLQTLQDLIETLPPQPGPSDR